MIYLKNPRSERRPTASDVIVLTVRQSNDPQSAAAFAGAKIPVSRIKSFPVRFQMNVNNVILPSSLSSETPTVSQSLSQQQQKEILWTRAMTNSDLIVEAVVCSREIALDRKESLSNNSSGDMKEMCRVTGGSSPISGQGYAKLVRISRNDDNKGTNEVTIIRGPAAIRLE